MPDAAEPTQVLRRFGPSDQVEEPKRIQPNGEGWRVEFKKGNPIGKLFGLSPDGVMLFNMNVGDAPRQGMVIRLRIKAEGSSNRFKLTALAAKDSTLPTTPSAFSGYLSQSEEVESSGDWVTLESNPASDEIQGMDRLTLSVTAAKYGAALVKDVELVSTL